MNVSAQAAKKPDDVKNASPISVSAIPIAQVSSASRQIDTLIEADYAKHSVKPNPLTSDELFVRRIYLDIVGRIPSHSETIGFLDSTDATGAEVADNFVEVPDFNATIAYGLGLPLKKIVKSASRRPFTVAHKGEPITQLF